MKDAPGPLSVLRVPPDPPTPGTAPGSARPAYPAVFRVLGAGGVYEVRTTPVGQFCARVEPLMDVHEGFYPILSPCPAALLGRTVEIFKERPDTEAMVTIVYDTYLQEHRIVWQGEKADRGSVHYDPLLDDDRYIVVVEIHSHHTMDAYFSPGDANAERATRAYGVVGRVDLDRPHALFRFACGELPNGGARFRDLRAETLFSPASEVWSLIDQPALF